MGDLANMSDAELEFSSAVVKHNLERLVEELRLLVTFASALVIEKERRSSLNIIRIKH